MNWENHHHCQYPNAANKHPPHQHQKERKHLVFGFVLRFSVFVCLQGLIISQTLIVCLCMWETNVFFILGSFMVCCICLFFDFIINQTENKNVVSLFFIDVSFNVWCATKKKKKKIYFLKNFTRFFHSRFDRKNIHFFSHTTLTFQVPFTHTHTQDLWIHLTRDFCIWLERFLITKNKRFSFLFPKGFSIFFSVCLIKSN